MNTVTIIVGLVVLIAILVCYAMVYQTSEQKKQNRLRALTALTSRARNFQYILSNLPDGFLTPELTMLLQKSLHEIFTQLIDLEPKNQTHQNNLQMITEQMSQQQLNPQSNPTTISDTSKFKEVKKCLEELHKFIFRLEDRKRISQAQGDAYRNMIRQLVLRFTIDSYTTHGRAAEGSDKYRLAIHYYDLAAKLIQKEGSPPQYAPRLQELQTQIKVLENAMAAQGNIEGGAGEGSSDPSNLGNEWDSFEQEDAEWKKKQVYD